MFCKSANKPKKVHEIAIIEVIIKGILVRCKEEWSFDFASAEVQVKRDSCSIVVIIVAIKAGDIFKKSLKIV